MTQTIRRKNCKTRREWAGNKVSDAQRRHPKLSMVEIAGLVAEAEHARAVRIVRRLKRGYEKRNQDGVFFDRIDTCAYILRLLTKGRA